MKRITVFFCLAMILVGLLFRQSTIYVKHRISSDKNTIDQLTEINKQAIEVIIKQQKIINEYRRLMKEMGGE